MSHTMSYGNFNISTSKVYCTLSHTCHTANSMNINIFKLIISN